ncbi:MAG TPA: hypothetical protein VLT58_10720, partial [Polyangia bacterium]|nr:hypothetical protein [Polyangia bacterium]
GPARGVLLALTLTAEAAGCSRARPAAPAAVPPESAPPAELSLPEVAGFVAAAPEPGDGFVRRGYLRDRARVQVTLARTPMSADDYQRWQSASAGFPQADLGLPAADANGFYQCEEGPKPSCDLLIQLRSGFHFELRGGGTTSRADVDALARGLPLRAWSAALPAIGR